MEKLVLSSPIQVSGLDDDKPYIELTTRLCWLDYPNLNNVGLTSDSQASYETLINMPVVAKLDKSGKKFGSHEVSIDDKGQYVFNTSAYGVHTEVYVEDDTVDIPNVGTITVPCLFAKSKIWKRFSSVVELIANKMTNPEKFNGGLWSSWELQGIKSEVVNGAKMYSEYQFLSNCLIDVPPAYGSASKTLLVASEGEIESAESIQFNLELEEAFMKDNELLLSQNQDTETREDKNLENQENQTSAITTYDLHKKVRGALNADGWDSVPYYSIFELYPVDNKAIAYTYERESEDEYVVVTYKVENEEVVIESKVDKKLSDLFAQDNLFNISELVNEKTSELSAQVTEKDESISQLNVQLEESQTKIADYEDKILKASESIATFQETVAQLESQVSEKANELETIKSELETYKTEEVERANAEKLSNLKIIAQASKQFTEEEISADEKLQEIFSNLDETALKLYIADKLITSAKAPVIEVSQTIVEKEEVEPVVSTTNLSDTQPQLSNWLNRMTTRSFTQKK